MTQSHLQGEQAGYNRLCPSSEPLLVQSSPASKAPSTFFQYVDKLHTSLLTLLPAPCCPARCGAWPQPPPRLRSYQTLVRASLAPPPPPSPSPSDATRTGGTRPRNRRATMAPRASPSGAARGRRHSSPPIPRPAARPTPTARLRATRGNEKPRMALRRRNTQVCRARSTSLLTVCSCLLSFPYTTMRCFFGEGLNMANPPFLPQSLPSRPSFRCTVRSRSPAAFLETSPMITSPRYSLPPPVVRSPPRS